MYGILRSMLLAVAMSIMAVGAAMASTDFELGFVEVEGDGGSAFLSIDADDFGDFVVYMPADVIGLQKPTYDWSLLMQNDRFAWALTLTSPLREVAASGTEPALY